MALTLESITRSHYDDSLSQGLYADFHDYGDTRVLHAQRRRSPRDEWLADYFR